jgi:hypothetical protein
VASWKIHGNPSFEWGFSWENQLETYGKSMEGKS